MELEHFSHYHPLILNEEHNDDFQNISCRGCGQDISVPCYSCSLGCPFFLHKLCAELTQEMKQKHPLHPQHPLTLLARSPYPSYWTCICDACNETCNNFTYHCSICKFDLDIFCAWMAQSIELKCHEHPLIPLQKKVLFFCDGCRQRHEGFSFQCTSCQFWVHQKCAWLPGTLQHSCHHHPLTLSYSLPDMYLQFRSYCELCFIDLTQRDWVYCCDECRYLVHPNCVTSSKMKETSMNQNDTAFEETEDLDPNLFHLPVIDESIDLVTHFIRGISLAKDVRTTELNHGSHQHPLIHSDAQQQSKEESSCSGSGCQQSHLNEIKNDVICEGCILPISSTTPLYSCRKCNFFLHEWCAELPEEMQHPCHPDHPLTVRPEVFGKYRCNGCENICSGFTFSCTSCQFNLNVSCASLPGFIRHDVHRHGLILREKLEPESRCNACDQHFYGFAFTCRRDTCNFKLHIWCALLPGTIRHRFDKHPFNLTYLPIKDIQEYFCEICERDINPKLWYYYCVDCDQSIHTTCIFPAHLPLPYFKWEAKWEAILCHNNHPHLLKFVEATYDDKLCPCCGDKHSFSLTDVVCTRCPLKLHHNCASLPNNVRLECDKHRLSLICSPIKDHSEKYYCQICNLEVDPKLWFYSCGDCNRFVHATCVLEMDLPTF